jgi:hypothetical protein
MSTDYRLGKPKSKKMSLADIPEKYWPPRAKGPDGKEIPWAETLEVYQYIMTYATNTMRAEKEAKLEAKQREEEQRIMTERQKQQREERKRRMKAAGKEPERQLRKFASGISYACYGCHIPLRAEYSCVNPNCQVHSMIDIGPLMTSLRRLVNIIGIDEANRLLGYTTSNTNTNKAAAVEKKAG